MIESVDGVVDDGQRELRSHSNYFEDDEFNVRSMIRLRRGVCSNPESTLYERKGIKKEEDTSQVYDNHSRTENVPRLQASRREREKMQ